MIIMELSLKFESVQQGTETKKRNRITGDGKVDEVFILKALIFRSLLLLCRLLIPNFIRTILVMLSNSPKPGTTEEDCLSCKIIGTTTFSGISLYAYHLRKITPASEKGNRLFFACFAVATAAVAIHRGFSDLLPK